MNLDRFSVPTANEVKHSAEFYKKFQDETAEEVKTCCGCNHEIDVTESFIESEIYGDDFIHELDECIIAYYTKENRKDLLWHKQIS